MRGEQVTVHRYTPGAVDAHGNATFTYTDVLVPGVAVSGPMGEEPGNNRTAVADSRTAYLYPEAMKALGGELDAQDEMTVRGTRYQVVGHPITWRHPVTGITAGMQARLERVEG